MRDINHLPRVPRYHISNFNGLLSGTFCTAVTRTPHRMLGLGEREPLPTQAGMVRDTLKAIARER